MSFMLTFILEVQVDIRDFIRGEPQEGFKRNVLTVLNQGGSAFGTDFIRQVKARFISLLQEINAIFVFKGQIMAMGALIMRRQRVDLGDIGHRRSKRGTDGSTAANDVMLGLIICHLNELMGDKIGNGIAVPNDTF